MAERTMIGTMAAIALAANWATCAGGAETMPVVFSDDFSDGMSRWETTDADPSTSVWKIVEVAGFDGKPTQALRVIGVSDYQPRYRSPFSIAWLKETPVGDFELTARAQSTNPTAGGHRDMCLFWGRQDADHFYYVHLGAKADPAACQIFIVNGAPRAPITVKKAEGTPWTNGWHRVKVVRRVSDGTMEVYFDDFETPLMTAKDTTFGAGAIGLGTFDDHGNWDDVELRAAASKPSEEGAQ